MVKFAKGYPVATSSRVGLSLPYRCFHLSELLLTSLTAIGHPRDMTHETGSPADWYFDDFEVGQSFRTQGRTITEADIVSFAGWSWDTNPVHTDAELSAGGRFGEPVAHGVLGLSVAMGLASRLGVFERCSVALLGIDGWRFTHPVVVGDTVRCTIGIIGARATSNGEAGILEREFVLTNQNDTVVQSGNIGLMVTRRPG